MNSLEELLHEQLKDLYSAEQQLTKALPKIARSVSTPQLKKAIESHLEETMQHVERLEEAAEMISVSLRGKKCKAMEGLLDEGKEALEEDGEANVLDASIIAAAQRVEHYEISAYGSARAVAEQLGLQNVVKLLQATLDEESAADEKLTQISEQIVLPASPTSEKDDADDEERTSGRARRKSRSGKEPAVAASRRR